MTSRQSLLFLRSRQQALCIVLLGLSGCESFNLFKSDPPAIVQSQSPVPVSPSPQPNPVADTSPVKEIKVAGEIITIDKVLSPLKPTLKADSVALGSDDARRKLQTTVGDAIGRAVDEVLLYQHAMADLTEEEEKYLEKFVDQIIREEVQKNHGGRQAAYERNLVQRGMTLADAREQTRRELMIQRYLGRSVFPKVADPTRAELLSYYEEIKDELSKAERREMFLIEVPIESRSGKPGDGQNSEDAVRAARTRTEAAIAELNNNAPFASVAANYSKGINAENGGAWGWVTRDGVRPRWQPAVNALYTLPEGGRSGIIESPEAFFIVQCGKVEGAQSADFVKMQAELMERYKKAQQGVLYNELLNKLRDRAGLDPNLMDRFLRTAVEEAAQTVAAP